eukprot:CAMPEP_0206219638 /NCGR_PEP_ID=MMETSP0047_2-20121206/4420_1 /ASSEMBLY_ACC=CAM_ASM_000192 /TAXON_ID=195065 /ORGANISM="Chroomonas mesostigmatica_cf, Strain CCMP1168" /LENGTH=53 /DNA_ID=CAMNT_0053642183 /DNA_START=447 /DNA_END=604 /DNA_ORIENTATION=+
MCVRSDGVARERALAETLLHWILTELKTEANYVLYPCLSNSWGATPRQPVCLA